MKKNHKILCLCLCITAMLFFVLSVQGQNAEIHTHGTAIGTEDEFLQMQNGGIYYLANDITVSETVIVNGEITLCLNGNILKYQNDEKNGSIFRISENGALNIHDCSEKIHTCKPTEKGLWELSEDVSEDVKKVMGGLIIGGTGETREIEELEAAYPCGGFAYAEGGVIRIYGGNIVGNTADFGGAVYLTENATLEIHGGKFSGNVSNYRGGAVFSQGGSVVMNDGMIFENQANKNGGGINISGNGKFTMNGGLITANKASFWSGGIENFGTFEMYGGTVSNNIASEDGGGVYNGGTFTMYGGSIRENIAKYGAGICNDKTFILHNGSIFGNLAQESGGGIYNAHTTEMYGGKISGNTARTSGGGIENDGTFDLYDGVIGGSETSDANAAYLGGGVCTYRGTFTMHGGRIEKNTGIDGGGVENEAVFVMTGGVITKNFASIQGGGISNRGELILKGNASITSNGSGTNSKNDHKSGGVYWLADEKSRVLLGESVRIVENTTNGESANFVIFGDGKATVSALTSEAHVRLTLLNKNKAETAGIVLEWVETENISADDFLTCFSSDNPIFIIKPKGNEIKLAEKNLGLVLGIFIGVFIVAGITAVSALFTIHKRKISNSKSFHTKKRKNL